MSKKMQRTLKGNWFASYGVVVQLQFQMECERPPAAFGVWGSLTHHLEFQLIKTHFQPWLQSVAATRLRIVHGVIKEF